MSKRITIRDVAAAAGVSTTTASRALGDNGRMLPETRQRVREIAAEIGYRPNSMARGLKTQRSFTLGLLTSDTYGRFTLPIAAGLAVSVVDRGVSVLLAACQEDPELTQLNLEALQEKQVDGLVIAGRRIDRSLPVDLTATGLPTIHVMSACPEGCVGFVPDDVGGGAEATRHLLQRGRRRIAYLTGPHGFEAARLREEGWQSALAEAGVEPWGQAQYGTWSEAHGFETAARIFAKGVTAETPDAVFCGNDQIARGLIDGLTQLGIRVPEDVAVIGFDNWEIFAAATRPPLTSVDMSLFELGKQAGLTLLDMIDGKSIPAGVRRMPTRIVERQSCGTGGAGPHI